MNAYIPFLMLVVCPLIALGLVTTKWFKYAAIFLKWTNGKPFNCYFCTGTWLTFACYCSYSPDWLILSLVALASGILTWLTALNYKLINVTYNGSANKR